MCYSSLPGIIDSRELLATAHAEKKAARKSKITAHASLNTNKLTQTITRVQMEINLPCRSSACVASDDIHAVLAAMYAEHTHSLLLRLFSPAAQWLVIGKLTGQHTAL